LGSAQHLSVLRSQSVGVGEEQAAKPRHTIFKKMVKTFIGFPPDFHWILLDFHPIPSEFHRNARISTGIPGFSPEFHPDYQAI